MDYEWKSIPSIGVNTPTGGPALSFADPYGIQGHCALVWFRQQLEEGKIPRPVLPAELVRIPDLGGQPTVPLYQPDRRTPTPAPQVPEIRWSTFSFFPVVDRTPPTFPSPRTPGEARLLASMKNDLCDFPKQLEAICKTEYAQFLRQHFPPLPQAHRLESKYPNSHKPNLP